MEFKFKSGCNAFKLAQNLAFFQYFWVFRQTAVGGYCLKTFLQKMRKNY
jgi:hypothetical protein